MDQLQYDSSSDSSSDESISLSPPMKRKTLRMPPSPKNQTDIQQQRQNTDLNRTNLAPTFSSHIQKPKASFLVASSLLPSSLPPPQQPPPPSPPPPPPSFGPPSDAKPDSDNEQNPDQSHDAAAQKPAATSPPSPSPLIQKKRSLTAFLPPPKNLKTSLGGGSGSKQVQAASSLSQGTATMKPMAKPLYVPSRDGQATGSVGMGSRGTVGTGDADDADGATAVGAYEQSFYTNMYHNSVDVLTSSSLYHGAEGVSGSQYTQLPSELLRELRKDGMADVVDWNQMQNVTADVNPSQAWHGVTQDEFKAVEAKAQRYKEANIAPQYSNRPGETGGPTRLQKQKHQINALAVDLNKKKLELEERRLQGRLSKAQTRMKYGW